MSNIIEKTFADQLAEMLHLGPDEGTTFTCNLPQGIFTVTISAELSSSERTRYEMLDGSRSVHIEGVIYSQGVEHHVSYDDNDGDGKIGFFDAGGMWDSAEFFMCEETDGMPHRFYGLLTEIIKDSLTETP